MSSLLVENEDRKERIWETLKRRAVGSRIISIRYTSYRRAVLTFSNGFKLTVMDRGDCSCGDAADLDIKYWEDRGEGPESTLILPLLTNAYKEFGGLEVTMVRDSSLYGQKASITLTLSDGEIAITAMGGGCRGWSELSVNGFSLITR